MCAIYTLDVDCIVDVISRNQYHQLEEKLNKQGFKQSIMEDVICRWFYDEVILDVTLIHQSLVFCLNASYYLHNII
jgi:hypothetical protein